MESGFLDIAKVENVDVYPLWAYVHHTLCLRLIHLDLPYLPTNRRPVICRIPYDMRSGFIPALLYRRFTRDSMIR